MAGGAALHQLVNESVLELEDAHVLEAGWALELQVRIITLWVMRHNGAPLVATRPAEGLSLYVWLSGQAPRLQVDDVAHQPALTFASGGTPSA